MKKVLFLFVPIILFWGCHQQPSSEISADSSLPASSPLNVTLSEFARVTAYVISHEPEVRIWLKSEAEKEFDGEYDVFLKHHLDHSFEDGEALATKLESAITKILPYQNGKDQLSTWLETYPTLQFSIPVNIERWNPENEVPYVSYLAEDFEEEHVTSIQAYKFGEEPITLSTKRDPSITVLVVGESERVDEEGNLLDFVQEILNYTPITAKNFRSNGDLEMLWQVHVPDMNAIEGWAAGKPEFKIVSNGFADGTEVIKYPPSRNRSAFTETSTTWVEYHFKTLQSWNRPDMGNHYVMHWTELDQTNLDADDDLGSDIISKGDFCWTSYDINFLRWYMECTD